MCTPPSKDDGLNAWWLEFCEVIDVGVPTTQENVTLETGLYKFNLLLCNLFNFMKHVKPKAPCFGAYRTPVKLSGAQLTRVSWMLYRKLYNHDLV